MKTDGPLRGLRVLDFTRVLSDPSRRLLAELVHLTQLQPAI